MSDARSVLLVEDDEGIRHVVAEVLTVEGYEVRQAEDGRGALAALTDWSPDVILLDLMMPGMDGWQFRAEQRARNCALDVPLIVLSASRRAGDAIEDLGAVAVIPKPFDLDALLEVVDHYAARFPS